MSELAEFVGADGIWCQVLAVGPSAGAARPALFLDRDGVIVDEVEYLHRPADARLVAGAAAVVAAANQAGVPVVSVTNQSGIGRGLYGWPEFAATEAHIGGLLAACGARLDMVLACPYHADGKPPYRHPAHPCRKPQPGMLVRAAERLRLDLARSWIVGDRASDLAAGRAAGLMGGVHVLTGHGPADRVAARALETTGFQVRLEESIGAASDLLTSLAVKY